MKFLLLFINAIVFVNSAIAQWTKVSSIPGQEMAALAAMNDTLYAASGSNKIYKSVNSGESWNELIVTNQSINIFTIKIIDSKIFIGTTADGIFISADFGATWTHSNSSLQWISGFVKFNQSIYAGTSGSGVYKYDANNQWIPFNNGLPSGWGYSVETIVATSDRLLIGAGGNGTYFYYDFGEDKWVHGYYYGQNAPGLIIQKIISQSDTLFGVDGRRILRSNNGGLNWSEDQTGTHKGTTRTVFLGSENIYTVTNILGGDAWIQMRSKNATSGTSWAGDEELFTTRTAYDIFEFGNKLFLATHEGLYVKDLLLDIEHSHNPPFNLQIFPSPSCGQLIHVTCNGSIESYTIATGIGQSVESKKVYDDEFTIEKSLACGIYYISVHLVNGGSIVQKIIVN